MLASREIHDVVPPVLELRVGEALAARIDPATVARWSQEIGARLGVPLPPVALPLRHAEVSRHRRTEEADAMPGDSSHELELLIRGRLVALGRFFPDRVQTLTRDWDGTEAQQAFPCFNEAQSEPVRWVEPSSLDGIGWRHPRWTFEQATVDWLYHLVRRHVAHVFGPDDLFAYLNLVAQQAGPARLPLSDLQSLANVLRGVGTVITRLVRERVPLAERNVDLMVRLIELARESDSLDVALAMPRLREHVRDDLCRTFADEANRLFLLLLDPADEQWLESNLQITKTGMRRNFKLAPEEALRLAAAVRDRFEEVARADHAAPVIVCRDYLRSPLFDVLQSFDPRIFVLSRTELSTDVRLTPRGLVRRFTAAPGAA
jgi:type III secretory pathway component EscV